MQSLYMKKNYLSPFPVDILSFVNNIIECEVAEGIIFRGTRSRAIHNFTMDVDTGYRIVEKFRNGVQWYMMQSKDFVSSTSFKLKNKNFV